MFVSINGRVLQVRTSKSGKAQMVDVLQTGNGKPGIVTVMFGEKSKSKVPGVDQVGKEITLGATVFVDREGKGLVIFAS